MATRAWAYFKNLDSTNYVELSTAASSGKIFAKLLAGESCLLRLGSDAQTPAATANTSACRVFFLILEL
jgi:hypothetical protein